jgi:hypothetical protein
MIIPVYNPSTDHLERSFLSQGVSAGVTTLVVDNDANFLQNDRIAVGELAREKTEIVSITGLVSPGSTLVVGPTTFPHEAGEPVTRLRYDSVRYYRSTTRVTGAYTLLATVAMDVDSEDGLTNYDDTTGAAAYFYKVTYYNSVTTLESSLSDPIAGSGYARNSVGFIIDEVLTEVGDKSEQYMTRTEMIGCFNEVNDDLLLRVKKPYSFLYKRVAISRIADDVNKAGSYIPYPADMWKFDRLDYNFQDPTTSPATDITYTVRVRTPEDFRQLTSDNTAAANDTIQFVSLDDATKMIRLWPHSLTSAPNVFYLYYWSYFPVLDSEGDLFITPTPRPYKLYALYKFYNKKSATDQTIAGLVTQYNNLYGAEMTRLKRGDRKDAGTPRGFEYLPQTVKGFRQY